MSELPRALQDRLEIDDLLVRYATALDGQDWDLLRTCFTPDARADYEIAGSNDGIDEIVATCRQALGGLDASQHLIGNVVVEVDGDEARARCYLHAQHVLVSPNGTNTFVVAGTYSDRLVRTPDGWRIAQRHLSTTWTDGNAGIFAEGAARLAAAEAGA